MISIAHLKAVLRLTQWLGPWSEYKSPPIHRYRVDVSYGTKTMALHLFCHPKKKPHGAIFLIPGVHFQGGEHPAIVRIAAIMAHAGFFVGVPSLLDFISSRITPDVIDQAEQAFASFIVQPAHPQTSTCIASISFGSLPAFGLASRAHIQEKISGVLTFGGYLEWLPVMQFCLDDSPGVPCDRRNFPIVFILLSEYWKESHNLDVILRAWDRYIEQTWRLEPKPTIEELREVAMPIAQQLNAAEQQIFLHGCGLTKDWKAVSQRAMTSLKTLDWLNNHTRIALMKCPIVAVHAMTDEIVPVAQAQALYRYHAHHPHSRWYRTGIYGHSGQNTSNQIAPLAIYRELRTLLAIIHRLTKMSLETSSSN